MEVNTQNPAYPDLEYNESRENRRESAFSLLWKQNLDPKYADLVCLLLCFITGLCDSSAYNFWSCFLGMQTGNTVFLGLGASNQPKDKPWGWLKSFTSITLFLTGSFAFSTSMRRMGNLRRGTLVTSFFVQTTLIIISVALIQADLIPHEPKDMSLGKGPLFLELIPIGLLAFQSAGAMACSRSLGFNEIPTVVLTSVYFDIASDQAKLQMNVKRNRRIGGVVSLLAGAIIGGWLSRRSGIEAALWMAAGLKSVTAVGWLFWRESGVA